MRVCTKVHRVQTHTAAASVLQHKCDIGVKVSMMYRTDRVSMYPRLFPRRVCREVRTVGPLLSHAVKTTKHDEDQSFRIRPEALRPTDAGRAGWRRGGDLGRVIRSDPWVRWRCSARRPGSPSPPVPPSSPLVCRLPPPPPHLLQPGVRGWWQMLAGRLPS